MTGDDLLSKPIALVVALAVVSLLPLAFMSLTAFVKISTVLQIVRSAIGAQSVPSSTVLMALSFALTLLAMAPVGQRIGTALESVVGGKKQDTAHLVSEGVAAVREPMRDFFLANARPSEVARFAAVAKARGATGVREADLVVLIPSFVVTELSEAFSIGFVIYLPFLLLDLVVSNVLLALGMQQMNPTQVSLPFKLLLFVAVNGWGLLSESLVMGIR
jgi:type III secretion protein R